MKLLRSLPALLLAGCAATAPPPAPAALPTPMPAATPSAAPSAVPPSPPARWLAATFTDVVGTPEFADTKPFDPRTTPRGGLFASMSDGFGWGIPQVRAFTISASIPYGMDPWAGTRYLQLAFYAPPQAGQRYALSIDAPTPGTARLSYHQESRFRQDIWAATAGTVEVAPGDAGAVQVAVSGATMNVDPRGVGSHSQAAGTFTIAATGLVPTTDMREDATPAPTARPDGLDLNGLWTIVPLGASPGPLDLCGKSYYALTIADPERDGLDLKVRTYTALALEDQLEPRLEGELAGGLVGDAYELAGATRTQVHAVNQPAPGREAYRLRHDAKTGDLVGTRTIDDGRPQPVTLRRPARVGEMMGGACR